MMGYIDKGVMLTDNWYSRNVVLVVCLYKSPDVAQLSHRKIVVDVLIARDARLVIIVAYWCYLQVPFFLSRLSLLSVDNLFNS